MICNHQEVLLARERSQIKSLKSRRQPTPTYEKLESWFIVTVYSSGLQAPDVQLTRITHSRSNQDFEALHRKISYFNSGVYLRVD